MLLWNKIKNTIFLGIFSLSLVSCLDSASSTVFFGWDDEKDPDFGWDTDLGDSSADVMGQSTSAVLTKFIKAKSCNSVTPCLKYVLRLPVEGESDLGVETLALSGFDAKQLKRLHSLCEDSVKKFIVKYKSPTSMFKKIRSTVARNVDKASCDIEIYNKKIEHRPKTKLKDSDIGLAFTLNDFAIRKFKKGIDANKVDITSNSLVSDSHISELYLGLNGKWNNVGLKDNAFSSDRITSVSKNLDDRFMDIKVDKKLQKEAVEKMKTIVKEGNLSSTIESYKKSALDLISKISEIRDLEAMSSMLRLGYSTYEKVCGDNCRIINEEEDFSEVFESSKKEDEAIFFDSFSLLVGSTIDGFFTEADAVTIKKLLNI